MTAKTKFSCYKLSNKIQFSQCSTVKVYQTLIIALFTFGCMACGGRNSVKQTMASTAKKLRLMSLLDTFKFEEPKKIEAMMEPAILLNDLPGKSGIGDSRLGGQPDLPDAFEWPSFEGKPMVFFGQINLAAVEPLDIKNELPTKGILYFFAYFKNPENKFGAEYDFIPLKQQYKILFFEGDRNKLKKRDFPRDLVKDYHFAEMPLAFELIYLLPPTTSSWKFDSAKLGKKDSTLFEKVSETYDDCIAEMILATPCPIQYAVEYDWAYAYLGSGNFDDPRMNKVRPDFVNLLSFSLDRFEAIGMSNCYFGIRRQDLLKKNFDAVIFIMQDT